MLGTMNSWSLVDICEAGKEQELWALERVTRHRRSQRGFLGRLCGLLLSLGVRGESTSLGCGLCGRLRIPRLQSGLLCGLHAAVRMGCCSGLSEVSPALALSHLSHLGPSRRPRPGPTFTMFCVSPTLALSGCLCSVAHLKDRRLSGGAGSPRPVR